MRPIETPREPCLARAKGESPARWAAIVVAALAWLAAPPARAQVIRPDDAGIRRDAACAHDAACDDGDVCTNDWCNPASGCVHEPNQAPCDDGNPCSIDDACSAGWCGGIRADNSVAAGVYSVCAVRSDGRLACWGLDAGGSVADPNASSERFLAVAEGYAHTCALRRDGRLECWGLDSSVSAASSSTGRYVGVQTGNSHTCAIGADGALACWGQGNYGQVSGPNASADRFRAFSAGGYGTCGVRLDGRLRCWGPNSRSQTSGPNASVDRFVSVSVGYFHTCAVRSDGRLRCWGLDDAGQVSGPAASAELYTAVSAGGFHTCALDAAGRVRCWGSDAYGQVSTAPAGAEYFVALSSGYNHSCARRADGRLRCWGWDEFAQVSGPAADPGAFGPPGPDCDDANPCTDDRCDPASGCVHELNAGPCEDGDACTVGDTCGEGFCHAGPAPSCDDANPCTDDRCDPAAGCVHTFPARACDDGDSCTTGDTCQAGACRGAAAQNGAACDDGNACTEREACAAGICAGGAAVNCDDANPCTDDRCDPASGCVHAANTAACDDADACTLTDVCAGGVCGAFRPAPALAAGTGTTCAVRQSGEVRCWGFDFEGQVSGPSAPAGPRIAVAAGHLHTCALGQDRSIRCWGWDENGQVSGPSQPGLSYSAVAAGYSHTCALTATGGLKCWGLDADGQVSGPNASAGAFTGLATGAFHTCALSALGSIACWGWNGAGQVSGPNAAAGTFREITAGYAHSCALRVDGGLQCWGSNSQGQVSGPNAAGGGFVSVRAGWNFTCALAASGRINCWGDDSSGQVSGPNASAKRYVALAAAESHACALGVDGRVTCWGDDAYGRVSGPNTNNLNFGPGVLDCDDHNLCTDDSCDASLGCRSVADDTNSCATSDPCQPTACLSGQCIIGPAADTDGDGRCDHLDNCPNIFNPDQDDANSDGTGNACAPVRINFATATSAIPPGYRQDVGGSFDAARTYGWFGAVSTRERTTARPLEFDTFAFTTAERKWAVELRNGDYDLRVVSGDPLNPQGPHRIRANGVTVVGDVSTATDQFIDTTVRIPVRNGRIDLSAGGTAGNTLINFLEANAAPSRPAFLRSINFQPASSARPDGWEVDSGLVFDATRGFGWNAAVQTRDRGLAFPQVLDTLAFTSAARTWELAVPNGSYQVFVSTGDPGFAQGPQRITVEGAVLVNNESTAAGSFLERQATVSVTDGRLTLVVGGAAGNTCVNYVTVQSAAMR